jgi:hypothetical protein
MNTEHKSNNERLRELVMGAGLSQPVALTIFNRGLGVRGLAESTWKGYFCNPESTRFRRFDDALLSHAEKVFTPLQKAVDQ